MWVNLRRWKGWTWPQIAEEGETLYPDRNLTWRAIYVLWSRAYAKKPGGQTAKEREPEKPPSECPRPDWESCHAQCANPDCPRPDRRTPKLRCQNRVLPNLLAGEVSSQVTELIEACSLCPAFRGFFFAPSIHLVCSFRYQMACVSFV